MDAVGVYSTTGWADGVGTGINGEDYAVGDNLLSYEKPDILAHVGMAFGNLDIERGKTKRWIQELFLDFEWVVS